jgi:Transposase DDE domain
LKERLYSQELKELHRTTDKSFIRNRCLNFPLLVLIMANFLKGSIQDELDQVFQALARRDVSFRAVTRSAFSQARRKISHSVFIDLLNTICAYVTKHAPLIKFHGMRVFAIDGSTFRLPETPEIRKEFGFHRNKYGTRSMARASLIHDVLNRVTLGGILASYGSNEMKLAWQHLKETLIPQGSLILMDRGYVDSGLLLYILAQGHHFCVRVRSDLIVSKELKKSGLSQIITRFKPTKYFKRKALPDLPVPTSFPVRVLRFTVSGTEYFLMTSLMNTKEVTVLELMDLYHQRWEIEESYKVKKCRMLIEFVSGKSAEVIRQDFYAKMFSECLVASIGLELKREIDKKSQNSKNEYQLCLTQALAKTKNVLVLLFFRRSPKKILSDLMKIFMKSLVEKAPGRKTKRLQPSRGANKKHTQSFGYRNNR